MSEKNHEKEIEETEYDDDEIKNRIALADVGKEKVYISQNRIKVSYPPRYKNFSDIKKD